MKREFKMTRFKTLNSAARLTFAIMLTTFSLAAGWWPGNFELFSGKEGQKDFFINSVINQNQFEGNWKQLKGALKEKWGKFTDDDLLTIEGKLERFEGKLQERYGDRKAEVKEWVDTWLQQHSFDAQSKKEK
jgi:uncharacterized protein YjbJ (UPF0337 family)